MEQDKISKLFKEILIELGHNVSREGLQETPKRYAKMLTELMTPKDFEFTVFSSEGMDEMIIVKDIPFYSLCEHHVAPFFGTATIAYIPNEKIVGLSKIPRALDYFSSGLQNQERITNDLANYLQKKLNAKGVAVQLQARHMCMEMRGVKKCGSATVTTKLLGVMKEGTARAEFLNTINK
jgi:GTP cyclohydrolase IA